MSKLCKNSSSRMSRICHIFPASSKPFGVEKYYGLISAQRYNPLHDSQTKGNSFFQFTSLDNILISTLQTQDEINNPKLSFPHILGLKDNSKRSKRPWVKRPPKLKSKNLEYTDALRKHKASFPVPLQKPFCKLFTRTILLNIKPKTVPTSFNITIVKLTRQIILHFS
jgi:hypothetical protein